MQKKIIYLILILAWYAFDIWFLSVYLPVCVIASLVNNLNLVVTVFTGHRFLSSICLELNKFTL